MVEYGEMKGRTVNGMVEILLSVTRTGYVGNTPAGYEGRT